MISRRRWLKIAGLTAASILTLPESSLAKINHGNVRQHASDKTGFYSNSYLIEGANSCVLIDAHLNHDEAADLTDLISKIRKPLEAIVITHTHPDHYLGLQHLVPRWPDTAIRSSKMNLDIIRTTVADWGPISNPLVPLDEGLLSLAGRVFECLLLPDAESVAPVVLYEADSKTLIAGDHVLNGQHLWLAEGRLDAWRRNLKTISDNRLIETVLPGHGAVGGPELFAATDAYLRNFLDLKSQSLTAVELRQEMLKRYPFHVFTEALDSSIRAHL
ncbi:MAG: MBL fold metallo-hydrolase [Tateyamaria sp.]|uniref:MBL fold metallo-hydrolase n=1 Tax=Tateyamaria sp. TaxID=1929288 RepID=UPI00329D6BDD